MNNMQPEDILGRLLSVEAKVQPRPKTEQGANRSCDHWTGPVLLERTAYLRKLARAGEGSASETIKAFPGHSAMLFVRLRNGPAELVETFALVLMVLEGRATLLTGGVLDKQKQVRAGEQTGAAIAGASTTELRAGDVVHVAASVPHQLLVPADKVFSYLALKMREIEED